MVKYVGETSMHFQQTPRDSPSYSGDQGESVLGRNQSRRENYVCDSEVWSGSGDRVETCRGEAEAGEWEMDLCLRMRNGGNFKIKIATISHFCETILLCDKEVQESGFIGSRRILGIDQERKLATIV